VNGVRRRWLAIAALLVPVAGCGGDDGRAEHRTVEHRKATVAEAGDIGTTIEQLERAIAHRDARAVCRLYSEDARRTATLAYATCASAVLSDLRSEKPVRLAVGAVAVRVDSRTRPPMREASAAVTSTPRGRSPFRLDAVLVQERGAWRIDQSLRDYLVE
jgi:hypothetical protein